MEKHDRQSNKKHVQGRDKYDIAGWKVQIREQASPVAPKGYLRLLLHSKCNTATVHARLRTCSVTFTRPQSLDHSRSL